MHAVEVAISEISKNLAAVFVQAAASAVVEDSKFNMIVHEIHSDDQF